MPVERKSGERSAGGREYVLAFGPADREARRAGPERDFWGQISVHQCPECAALVVEDFMPDHAEWHKEFATSIAAEMARQARRP